MGAWGAKHYLASSANDEVTTLPCRFERIPGHASSYLPLRQLISKLGCAAATLLLNVEHLTDFFYCSDRTHQHFVVLEVTSVT